ncbi:aminoacyl-histidine dipeptidase [Culturomica massiliensis]|jgi:dipeptidase D|uniref:aminoacyl-histidine dipeptidase n=1 Tax=Culturomica massiliensis TaxID=1841857 RepID=UPI000338E0AB|nr:MULTISPECIES: aminoacyl-histidine dipeptidase [Odoribacteraceae]RHV91604.1 aminoacyl-histidine dipeptidase [Odoribacter sp. OF09-27XD]CCZ10849.1 aminoacyl-histidine dipeptidase [Odoribacter sp. CAG:788]
MDTIKDLQPKAIWENFYKLTQVPRPSNHEEKAREFMMNWAKEHHIDARMDEAGNIIMTKPATPGMENRKGIILQGHLDMVPQKNEDTRHDFTKDPIDAYIDGEWVRAKGTTLGADNGMGVAAAMAVLTATDIQHGPIEVLITATEETGMDGANGLKPGVLKGDILLNLDSETEGELYVGCAGGLDATVEFNYKKAAVPAGSKAYKLALKGLKGGHSGMDINLGRGNSNKLLFRFLKTHAQELNLQIATINGGSLRNAIPRETFAVITLPAANADKFLAKIKEAEAIYKAELIEKDPDVKLSAEETEMPAHVMDADLQWRLTDAILGCPNGTVRMIDSMPDTVETSNNLAIVQTRDDKIVINTLMRSSVETAKDYLAECLQSVFELAKADNIQFDGAYPGWKPNPQSAILKSMQDTYRKMFNKEARIMAVHAGLECGILGAKYPGWDMISFGPTICHPHSPDEKVNIPSVGKFWEFLKETLKEAPKK